MVSSERTERVASGTYSALDVFSRGLVHSVMYFDRAMWYLLSQVGAFHWILFRSSTRHPADLIRRSLFHDGKEWAVRCCLVWYANGNKRPWSTTTIHAGELSNNALHVLFPMKWTRHAFHVATRLLTGAFNVFRAALDRMFHKPQERSGSPQLGGRARCHSFI